LPGHPQGVPPPPPPPPYHPSFPSLSALAKLLPVASRVFRFLIMIIRCCALTLRFNQPPKTSLIPGTLASQASPDGLQCVRPRCGCASPDIVPSASQGYDGLCGGHHGWHRWENRRVCRSPHVEPRLSATLHLISPHFLVGTPSIL
jgi:hypothetical protein